MNKFFQNKYAMTEEGAKDLKTSVIWSIFMYISYMLPMFFSFYFLSEYMNYLFDGGQKPDIHMLYMILIGIGILLVIYFIAYIQYGSTYTKTYEESSKTRISLAEKLRQLPLSFFAKKDVSDLSATIMEDVTQIETLFSHAVPQLYSSIFVLLLMTLMIAFYNWKMALAIFWVIPISALIFYLSRSFQKKSHKKLYNDRRVIGDKVQEGVDSAQEIKSYNQEGAYFKSLNRLLDHHESLMIKSELLIGAFINISQAFLRLGLPSVILYGGYLFTSDKISIFTYIVFIIIAARIYEPVFEALNNFAMLLFLEVRINRMREMQQMPIQQGTKELTPDGYDITFNDVSFSYEKGQQTIQNISLTAKQGEITALVGPSGGGKSTVTKLSARFWDVDSGNITMGGVDIASIDPETLLRKYSIVFQDVTLFNDTILENIRLGKKGATDEEVMEAAKLAQCDEFINELKEGYHTVIGENGEKLSGGERQRISIARAILKDAPIILLDEATASLDAENETRIQKALGALIKNKTVIIIAHRMRTVMHADKIVVIKDGSVAETGAPKELLDQKGLFASMVDTQYNIG